MFSALLHASWNFFIRDSDDPELSNSVIHIYRGVISLPIILVYFLISEIPDLIGWIFIIGTSIIHILYFFFLGKSYKHGELSFVYPISRGLGIGLIPLLGVIILNEKISFLGLVSILLIFTGVLLIGGNKKSNIFLIFYSSEGRKFLKSRAFIYSVLTGLSVSAYSVWDKQGVQYVDPLFYMSTMCVGSVIAALGVYRYSYSHIPIKKILRENLLRNSLGAIFSFLSYVLILSALQISQVSLIAPLREIGVVIGVIFGLLILKEKLEKMKAIGIILILFGTIIIISLV
ncbi:MAG: EamA family transporter [Dehalococcoidia bacterium]